MFFFLDKVSRSRACNASFGGYEISYLVQGDSRFCGDFFKRKRTMIRWSIERHLEFIKKKQLRWENLQTYSSA